MFPILSEEKYDVVFSKSILSDDIYILYSYNPV